MSLSHSITLFLIALLSAPAMAQEDRVAAERKETTPVIIPLREALGGTAFDQAIESGRYSYAGNLKCRLCHKSFFEGRKKDAHDHAFEVIIEARDAENPRCLGCHTTGAGVKGGFTTFHETSRLMNVQCEGCHGPGSEHIRLVGKGGLLAGPDRPEILKKMCLSCHNARWNRSFSNFEAAFEGYKAAKPDEATAFAKRP